MRDHRRLLTGILVLVLCIPACRHEEEKPAPTPTKPPALSTEPPAATVIPEAPTPEPEPTPARVEEPEAEDGAGSVGDLELLGIVRGGGSGPSALIGFKGNQEIFRKGDAVFDHGTVKEVRVDSVVIHSGSGDATLKLARDAPVEGPPPAAVEKAIASAPSEPALVPISEPLSRAETRSALKDFSTILSNAEARRVAVGGGHGIELGNADGSSFLAKLGLRSGDILQKLNAITIDDPDHLPNLSSAADGKELTVSFWRSEVGLTISRRLQ
jgi:type II secretory pathway component PulC